MNIILFRPKVETIGDAYCVAGGLYRDAVAVECAESVAKMALVMMSSAKTVVTQEGNPIKVCYYSFKVRALSRSSRFDISIRGMNV